MNHKIGNVFKHEEGIYRIKEFIEDNYHGVEWIVGLRNTNDAVEEEYPNSDLDDDIKLSGNNLIKILYNIDTESYL